MKSAILLVALVAQAAAFVPSANRANLLSKTTTTNGFVSPSPLATAPLTTHGRARVNTGLQVLKDKEAELLAKSTDSSSLDLFDVEDQNWVQDSKKVELVLLSIWLVTLSGFILTNNFYGPWPLFMKSIPERVFFLSHMVGGMLFGGGIILTTCIERLVAKSANAPVLQFWFDKVPVLDGLIVVPALTISMFSGTGLSIVRYGGLNIAPPHVGAIFWTLIAFMIWWGVTDLTTQGSALEAVNEMYAKDQEGEVVETPKVVVDRHISNVVSCFFVLLLYSMMVMKPGTLFPFPWSPWT